MQIDYSWALLRLSLSLLANVCLGFGCRAKWLPLASFIFAREAKQMAPFDEVNSKLTISLLCFLFFFFFSLAVES